MKKAFVSSSKEVHGCVIVESENVNCDSWKDEVMKAVKSKK